MIHYQHSRKQVCELQQLFTKVSAGIWPVKLLNLTPQTGKNYNH